MEWTAKIDIYLENWTGLKKYVANQWIINNQTTIIGISNLFGSKNINSGQLIEQTNGRKKGTFE